MTLCKYRPPAGNSVVATNDTVSAEWEHYFRAKTFLRGGILGGLLCELLREAAMIRAGGPPSLHVSECESPPAASTRA